MNITFFFTIYQSINQLQQDIDDIQQQREDNEKMKITLMDELLRTKGLANFAMRV